MHFPGAEESERQPPAEDLLHRLLVGPFAGTHPPSNLRYGYIRRS